MKLQSDDNLRKKPFKFFKIILHAILNQHRLRIPEKFSKKFGPELSKVVTLTIPTGLSWKIASSRIEDKLYLTQGWDDFREDNDIRYGYFLEFEYYGNSHFQVHIFNLTCCEIDYPVEYDLYRVEQKNTLKQDHAKVEKDVEVDEAEDENEESHSADRIQKSKCENPSFTITLRKYAKAYLHIPRDFTKEYMNGSLLEFVKLQVGNRVWRVKCYRYKARVRLTAGWGRFLEDNNWDEGESYTFVLVAKKRTSIAFKVFK